MNFEITDKREYKTTHWYIESENDNYNVICQEGDLNDEWVIRGEYEDEVHIHSYLGVKLIDMCKNDNSKLSNIVPSGEKPVIYQVYDTNDNEVLFKGSKKQILDWMWENLSKGLMGIEINQIN